MIVSTQNHTVKKGALRIKNKMWDKRSGHFTESYDALCWHLQTSWQRHRHRRKRKTGENRGLAVSHALAFRFHTVMQLLIHKIRWRIHLTNSQTVESYLAFTFLLPQTSVRYFITSVRLSPSHILTLRFTSFFVFQEGYFTQSSLSTHTYTDCAPCVRYRGILLVCEIQGNTTRVWPAWVRTFLGFYYLKPPNSRSAG
jgi:hypothetical protein